MLEQSGLFRAATAGPEGEAELTRVLRFTLVIYFGWQTDKLRWARSTQRTGRERRETKARWGGLVSGSPPDVVRRACLPTETETFRPHISEVRNSQRRRRRRWPEFKPLQTSTVSLPPLQTPS